MVIVIVAACIYVYIYVYSAKHEAQIPAINAVNEDIKDLKRQAKELEKVLYMLNGMCECV